MRLYLVQHGDAHPEAVSAERELTPRGRADVEGVAALLARSGLRASRVLHSGKTRARQSAEILAASLAPGAAPQAIAGIDPSSPAAPFVEQARGWTGDTLVAGHLPFMNRAAALLLAGREDPPVVSFQPGSIACLERDASGRWTLAWMLRPELVGR
jgi:phosphohistidine phosphatase